MALFLLFGFNLGLAAEPRLGVKIFEDGQYPQVAGNTGKVSYYFYKEVDGKTKVELRLGDLNTGKSELLDLELAELPPSGGFAWAPDGKRLAVVRKDLTICDIYEYTFPKPYQIKKLTDLPPFMRDYNPEFKKQLKIEDKMLLNATFLDWSRDGKQIAFSLLRATDASVWVVDLETGKARQVTKDNFGASPCWSVDGKMLYIAGLCQKDGKSRDAILTLNLDDYSTQDLICEDVMSLYPRLSPDGRYIVYGRKPEGERQTIYVYDLQKKKAAPLVILGEKGSATFPVWTSDGKAVLYQFIGDGKYPDIYKIDFNPSIFE